MAAVREDGPSMVSDQSGPGFRSWAAFLITADLKLNPRYSLGTHERLAGVS